MCCFISRFSASCILTKIAALSSLLSEGGPYFSDHVTENQFLKLYLNLTAKEISSLAHQPQDMFKSCVAYGPLENEKCAELQNGSKRVFSPEHGVCYMFNNVHKTKKNTAMQINIAGPSDGLSLNIDVESMISC